MGNMGGLKIFDLKHNSFCENKTPNRPNYFFGFTIIGPKKKVVINFIYGYQNISGEKCKTNGKGISSIRHTSEEKNPKNNSKVPYFRKYGIFGDQDQNQDTWDESVFLAKKNPPSLPSSFLVRERCQVSPKKISKSGHWRILRNRTFCT